MGPAEFMKVAIIAKSNGDYPDHANMKHSTKSLNRFCGGNTGNLVFWKSVCQMVTDYDLIYWNADPNKINQQYKSLIWLASNEVGPHDAGQSGKANYLQQINIPMFAIGLGAQAEKIGDEVHVSDGTKKLIAVASEKISSIGVRGEFSKSVLIKLGVHNTIVTGCPSLHLNPNPTLGSIIEAGINKKWNKVAVLQNNRSIQNSVHFDVEAKLIQWMKQTNGKYLCQHPSYVFDLVKQDFIALSNNVEKGVEKSLVKLFGITDIKEIIQRFIRVYMLIPEWSDAIRRHDVCIGGRLHSNFLSIANGVPGIVIPIDSRTRELAETCKLPIVEMKDVLQCDKLEELKNKIKWDGANAFDDNRTHLKEMCMKTIKA